MRATLLSRVPRLFFFAGVSVGLGGLILVTKVGLLIAAPDWFLLANIFFAAGSLAAKLSLLRRRAMLRGCDAASARAAEQRAYQWTGFVVVALSAGYLITLIPAFAGVHADSRPELWAAISIAVIAFTELVLSLTATVAGRRDVQPIASAIRRVNLATAMVLIGLAQSALVSAVEPDGARVTAVTGLGFGIAAAIVGGDMLVRSRRRAAPGAIQAIDRANRRGAAKWGVDAQSVSSEGDGQ